jgi:hypothetical protein
VPLEKAASFYNYMRAFSARDRKNLAFFLAILGDRVWSEEGRKFSKSKAERGSIGGQRHRPSVHDRDVRHIQ